MREPALAKNKSASVSLSFATSFAPRSVFCPPRTCLSSWRRIFRRLLSHQRCTRACIDRICRAFDYERSNRARARARRSQSRSPPVIAIYRRIKMAYEENCFLNKLQAFHSGIPDASPDCLRVRNVTLTSTFLATSQSKLLDNFFGLTKVLELEKEGNR